MAIEAAAIVICVVAGIRMQAGKGAFWGSAVAGIMILSMLQRLVTGQFGLGIIISVVLMVVLIQGVRGSFALRKNEFEEDELEAFN